MDTFKSFAESLENINEQNFTDIALQVFKYQAGNNPVYKKYLQSLKCDVGNTHQISQIPFFPIEFFKHHQVKSGDWIPKAEFTSSGTTGMVTSRHLVYDLALYKVHSERIFANAFGSLNQYHFLALLPSYLEREGSSLIEMMKHFIACSGSPHSGFYLHNHKELIEKIAVLKSQPGKVILWGVSFALLDLAEAYEIDLSNCLIFETGGMKGRRKEWIREELHRYLTARFNVPAIHSEYGMTELMSQAYSFGNGFYHAPSCMKVFVRNINDPFEILPTGRTGAINIVDLANFHSCSFIETQDLGVVHANGQFEVLGRIDNSDIRGCNLLVG